MKSGALDLMRQMLSPSLVRFRFRFQAAAEILSRYGPCCGYGLSAGVAMVAFRIHRGFREDRASFSALQGQSRAVVLVPHQMNRSASHEMNKADRVAQVKDGCARGELAFAAPQSLKE